MDECLPRPNNQPPVSIRKSAFGRTNLFLSSSSTTFKEVKCMASTIARQATASIYHMHDTNKLDENIETTSEKKPIVCWHCCHSFEGKGFQLPRSYDPAEKVYHVYGCFCSANCCKAYILEHATFDRGYQMNVFVRMLREVYGISSGIIESPPRISLKMFGGPFDIESFRNQKNVCYVVHPPFVSYCMLIEERQPIQSIGESLNDGTVRGTVKGLRRPEPGSVKMSDDDFVSPESDGLYSKFLTSKNIDFESDEEEEKNIKRTRFEKNEKPKKSSGLARFASG